MRAAWIENEAIDTETLARLTGALVPGLFAMRIADPACASALAIEATEVFQQMHFSFDSIYWDGRDFPDAVAAFAAGVMQAVESEPEWLNGAYIRGRERLLDLLARHPSLVER